MFEFKNFKTNICTGQELCCHLLHLDKLHTALTLLVPGRVKSLVWNWIGLHYVNMGNIEVLTDKTIPDAF